MAIKVKLTYVRLDILNNLLNYINRHISKDINSKAYKGFLVAQRGVWGGVGVGIEMSSVRWTDGGWMAESESEAESEAEAEAEAEQRKCRRRIRGNNQDSIAWGPSWTGIG